MLAGTAAIRAHSFGWASPRLSVVRLLLIDSVWAGHAFYLRVAQPVTCIFILNPLESKLGTKFLTTGL